MLKIKRAPNICIYDLFLTLVIAFTILYMIHIITPNNHISVYLK